MQERSTAASRAEGMGAEKEGGMEKGAEEGGCGRDGVAGCELDESEVDRWEGIEGPSGHRCSRRACLRRRWRGLC